MKKKLLTLVFTLILLIGLVAAVGMNASAAAPIVSRQVIKASTMAELQSAFANATDGTTICLTANIQTDEALTQIPFDDKGTVVLDLNGKQLTAADGVMPYLIKIGKNSKLHVVNSNLSYPAIINYDSTYSSGMFLLGGKDAQLYLYSNLQLRAGYNDNHAKTGVDLSIVKITDGSKLYISGTTLQNRMFKGLGILFNNRGSNPFDNFTLKIEGGAKISAKVACIAYYGNYPGNSDVNVCDLYYDDTKIGGDSGSPIDNFKALYYDGSDETFTLDDVITGDSKMQYVDSIGTLSSYTKIKSFPTGYEYNVMKIENPSAKHVCTPEPNIVFLKGEDCYHLMNCTICGEIIILDKCDKVGRIEAKCTVDGQTAGFKCSCGNVTSEVIPATGHKGGTATCKAKAKCTVCGVSYGSVNMNNHNSLTTLKAVAATCTKTGLTEGKKCTACGVTTVAQKTVAKKAHTLTTLKAVAATYKADGKTEGKKCTACGTVTVAQKKVARKTLKKVSGLKTKAVKLASGTKTTLTLSWSKTTGAEKYEIQQYVSKKWKTIKTTSKTSYTVSKLKANKSYKFRVRAIAGSNKGAFSSTYTGKTVPLTPAVTLKAGKKALTASWKTVANITGYEVQASTSKKFTSKTTKKVTIKKAKTTKTTIKKLTKGKKYYVKVRAYKTVGKTKVYSAWSTVKNVKVK